MSRNADVIKKYIQLLGNPYAKEQLDTGASEAEDLALREATEDERSYARKQANQYTLLSVSIADSHATAIPKSAGATPRRASSARAGLSKADFVTECRRMLRPYIPAAEKGRLRRHHQDFITRNQNRTPAVRLGLVKELAKYDLSVQAGITAQFNRERDLLTERKLRQIERAVLETENK